MTLNGSTSFNQPQSSKRPRDPRLNRPQAPASGLPAHSSPKRASQSPIIWTGSIDMPGAKEVQVSMHLASNSPQNFKDDLPRQLVVKSRISPKSAHRFIGEMTNSLNKMDVAVVTFRPQTDTEVNKFGNLIEFLKSLDRCGIFGHVSRSVKEFYLYPLYPNEEIPPILSKSIDEGTIASSKGGILLGILLIQKISAPLPYLVIPARKPRQVLSGVPKNQSLAESLIPSSFSNPFIRCVAPISTDKVSFPESVPIAGQSSKDDISYSPSSSKVGGVMSIKPLVNSQMEYVPTCKRRFEEKCSKYEPDYIKSKSNLSNEYCPARLYKPAPIYRSDVTDDNVYVPEFIHNRKTF